MIHMTISVNAMNAPNSSSQRLSICSPHNLIFNTPLVDVSQLFQNFDVAVYLKIETLGPSHSAKDRAVYGMYHAAKQLGKINRDTTIIEATCGNEAVALAALASMYGHKLIVVAPESISQDILATCQSLGATFELTPEKFAMSRALQVAEQLTRDDPKVWSPKLFENHANAGIHEATTGPEILRAVKPDFFVAGVGSGGVFTGIARYLKRTCTNVQLVAVEPLESQTLSQGRIGVHGIPGLGAGFIPPVFDPKLPNQILPVSTQEAHAWTERLAKQLGLLSSVSTGANLAAIARLVENRENRQKAFVSVLFAQK
ncbi:MAG: cysteine synthase family protein [Planctomycetia bacterium]|nr:cysteine synthase family protein [Planctomycetia bacterium]